MRRSQPCSVIPGCGAEANGNPGVRTGPTGHCSWKQKASVGVNEFLYNLVVTGFFCLKLTLREKMFTSGESQMELVMLTSLGQGSSLITYIILFTSY